VYYEHLHLLHCEVAVHVAATTPSPVIVAPHCEE
jgi:hypothetical protein